MTIRTVVETDRAARSSGSTWWIRRGRSCRSWSPDYGLHPLAVKDCLDPEHLPKFEAFENHTFVILRAVDADAPPDRATRSRS